MSIQSSSAISWKSLEDLNWLPRDLHQLRFRHQKKVGQTPLPAVLSKPLLEVCDRKCHGVGLWLKNCHIYSISPKNRPPHIIPAKNWQLTKAIACHNLPQEKRTFRSWLEWSPTTAGWPSLGPSLLSKRQEEDYVLRPEWLQDQRLHRV